MTAMEVMVKLQEAIYSFEITGGSLKPNNYVWYLIGFKFNKGKWEYKEAAQELEKYMSEMSLDGRRPWINTQ